MRANLILNYLIISMFIFGCAGSSPSSTPQTLNWGYCDPQVYSSISQEMIDTYGDRLTCTKMQAPLDYANPSRGTIEIALSRVSAGAVNERQGAIFFNRGGPGGDGLNLAPNFGKMWLNANPNDPLGSKLYQLAQKYDLIGFSPRGVGSSTQLLCQLPGSYYLPVTFAEIGQGLQNQYNIYKNIELNAKACQANALTPFINSDATARDMDLARSLIGDQKLSYVGFSYGTWLGAWYASLFPNHVDKMILDSNFNITDSIPMAWVAQPEALQYNLDNFIAPYAALNDNLFKLGSDPQIIREIFSNLNLAT